MSSEQAATEILSDSRFEKIIKRNKEYIDSLSRSTKIKIFIKDPELGKYFNIKFTPREVKKVLKADPRLISYFENNPENRELILTENYSSRNWYSRGSYIFPPVERQELIDQEIAITIGTQKIHLMPAK